MQVFSPDALAAFYQTPVGQQLKQQEQALLERLTAAWVGYDLLVLGQPVARLPCAIRHQWHFAQTALATPKHARYDGVHLPIATDSIDGVILCHELVFSPDGDALLDEVARVLIPQGKVVVLGMNPLSPWQVAGPWISAGQTQHRLAEATLHTEDCHFVGNGLLQKLGWRHHFSTMESRYFPWLQRSYAVVAIKRVIRLTLIRPKWSVKPITLGVTTPSRRMGVWREESKPEVLSSSSSQPQEGKTSQFAK